MKIQRGETAEIADRNDDQQPFQDGHDYPVERAYIALTMFSVTFLASPSSIMVLSR